MRKQHLTNLQNMEAYLSKIASRFGGPAMAPIAPSQAILPVRIPFGLGQTIQTNISDAKNTADFTYPELQSDTVDTSCKIEDRQIAPNPGSIASTPIESIRKLIHSDIIYHPVEHEASLSPEEKNDRDKDGSLDSSITFERFKDNEQKGNITSEHRIERVESTTTDKTVSFTDPMLLKKSLNSISSENIVEKIIMSRSLTPKSTAVLNKPNHDKKSTPLSKPSINDKIVRNQLHNPQLKPSHNKRMVTHPLPRKKRDENRIRIGRIQVEIVQDRTSTHKTKPQKLPQRETRSQSRPSVNKPRFPLRFGLGQI